MIPSKYTTPEILCAIGLVVAVLVLIVIAGRSAGAY